MTGGTVVTVLVILAVVAVVAVVVSIVVIKRKQKKQKPKGAGVSATLDRANMPVATPEVSVPAIQLVPRDVDTHVETWSDDWHFAQPDRGTVSFDVQKDSGLIVSLADRPGHPHVGYAVTIDRRGGVMTNFLDTVTSMTYISRLPVMDAPINSSAMVRNVELDADTKHHFDISYEHGYIEVSVDGRRVLACNDKLPTPGVQYVGLGDCGLKSGVGMITNLVIR